MPNGLSVETRFSDLGLLHPQVKARFLELSERLLEAWQGQKTESCFLAFETYRTPQRQAALLAGSVSTKAGPFESSHQYGLAVDFVPYRDGKWSWDDHEDWNFLDGMAAACGLVRPIRWDRPHIEHPAAAYLMAETKLVLARKPLPLVDGQRVLAGYEAHGEVSRG